LTDPTPQWPKIMSAYYGTSLTADEAVLWHSEMADLNPKNSELCEAIRMARNAGLKPDEWRATVTDLHRWLVDYRYDEKIKKERAEFEQGLLEFIKKWRKKFNDGEDLDGLIVDLGRLCVPEHEWHAIIRRIRGDEA